MSKRVNNKRGKGGKCRADTTGHGHGFGWRLYMRRIRDMKRQVMMAERRERRATINAELT